MKTVFCLGFVMATGIALVACDDGSQPQSLGSGGTAGTGGGGGTGGGTGVTAGNGGTAASSGGTSSSVAGGGSSGLIRGDVLEFVPGSGDVPYAIGANPNGITGGGFLAKAANGNTITVGDDAGKICISGNLEEVPDDNYSAYWGVEIGFNLNQGAPDGASGAGGGDGNGGTPDASGAAGAPAEVARAWMPGNVIGFSFVLEGPTINLIRFKALPSGLDPSLESSVYCNGFTPETGAVSDVLFTDMTQYCWSDGNPSIPLTDGLANISWQLPADVGVGARPFDWCLKDLRPIFAE